jgi:hypothetical protein
MKIKLIIHLIGHINWHFEHLLYISIFWLKKRARKMASPNKKFWNLWRKINQENYAVLTHR